jgi:hypothetical protein
MKSLDAILSEVSLEEEADSDIVVPWLLDLGFELQPRELFNSFMWDGHSFNENLPDRHLIHELAHLVLATPDRRTVPEFGLGPGPETVHEDAGVSLANASLTYDGKVGLKGVVQTSAFYAIHRRNGDAWTAELVSEAEWSASRATSTPRNS